ncbi:MAG: alcohol dehydrogenase, partial [Pseudomonadota bacterium]
MTQGRQRQRKGEMSILNFDYIVVGAGSAGCVLAARLSEDPSVQVALIEAGPPDTSALIHCPAGIALMARTEIVSQGFNTVPQPGLLGRTGYQPRGRTLGGSSSTNAMAYIRGQQVDYDTWADRGCSGWAWADVLPYFLKAEHNERIHNEWHGQNGPLNVADLQSPNAFAQRFVEAGVQAGLAHTTDFNGPTQEGVGLYQVTQRAGERFSAAKAYLTPNRSRANLHVMTGVTVDRIGLVDGVARQVHTLQGGQSQTLTARREIILSAGAFQSPALLMRSGIGPAAHLQSLGIEVLHHLPGVGENLHDHPDAVLVADAPGQTDLIGVSPRGAWRTLQALWAWRQHRTGGLTTNFAEGGAFYKSRPDEAHPDIQLHFVVAKLVDHGRQLTLGHGYSLHVCLLQPDSRGRVQLTDRNPHSAPLIDPQFLSEPRDVQRLRDGIRQAQRILAQPALAAYGREWAASANARTDEQLEHWIRKNADTVYHPVGTCRMGQDAMAVVDAQLRVHGVPGLRVVDASVMPRIVSGNTNAPTIMIA